MERETAAQIEPPRVGVGGEAGALDDFLHPLPGRFADAGLVVEHEGHGCSADSGDPGDIPDGEIGHENHLY